MSAPNSCCWCWRLNFLMLILCGCTNNLPPSGVPALTSIDAYEASERGELLVIDIRPDDERIRDGAPMGVASAAFPTLLFADQGSFIDRVVLIVHGNREHPLALLCRRGVTSRRAQVALFNAGFRYVYNIADGFLGSEAGLGWRGWGLPIAPPPGLRATETVRQ